MELLGYGFLIWTDIILWDIWDGILFMCSLHAIKKGFIKNIGYTVFIEKNLIVAGFYRWIGYSNIKCKLFHVLICAYDLIKWII